jgi:hypothetical protein
MADAVDMTRTLTVGAIQVESDGLGLFLYAIHTEDGEPEYDVVARGEQVVPTLEALLAFAKANPPKINPLANMATAKETRKP